MVDCRESKKRYRLDQVRGRWVEAKGRKAAASLRDTSLRVGVGDAAELDEADLAARALQVLQPASQEDADRARLGSLEPR